MKISFDYDDTLEHKAVQEIARELISVGYTVCIVTTRYSDTSNYTHNVSNDQLFKTAKKLGITEIHFTEYEWKYNYIDKWNIDLHIDDNNRYEVLPIESRCKCRAIWYTNWDVHFKDKLYKLISEIEGDKKRGNLAESRDKEQSITPE